MYMKIARSRDVKMPMRANPGDAIDFFIPNDFESVDLTPHTNIVIPSGIKVEVPFGYGLLFVNKSGIASKKSLVVGACVSGNTLIITDKGPISASILTKEYSIKNNIRIKSYNINENCIRFNEFDGFRISGKKEVLRLTFDNGTSMDCSNDHMVFTSNGWKMAKDLNENDEIVQIK